MLDSDYSLSFAVKRLLQPQLKPEVHQQFRFNKEKVKLALVNSLLTKRKSLYWVTRCRLFIVTGEVAVSF